jgi:apolipoprotein N-acyltransferase
LKNHRSKERNERKRSEIFLREAINAVGNSVIACIGLLGECVRVFGWPGVVIFVYFYILLKFSTDRQKEELIDLYFLGKDIGKFYWMMAICILVIIVFFAQRNYYKKKIKIKDEEIKRISKWKTNYQERTINKNLHHTDKKSRRKTTE